MAPALQFDTVVVPLVGGETLENCLAALRHSGAGAKRRTIVVMPSAMWQAQAQWEREQAGIEFVSAKQDNVPSRRRQGVATADAEVVALLEDTSWPQPGWAAAVAEAFGDPDVLAAGGQVRVSPTLSARGRALGHLEYGAFGPGRREPAGGPQFAGRIPGNNMAFRRQALLDALCGARKGLVEQDVVARMLAAGGRIVTHPGMSVCYAGSDRHGAQLATRFHHGRLYASDRLRAASTLHRVGYVAKTVLLPAVLALRALSAAALDVPPRQLIAEAAWIAMMATAWSAGEAVGALSGAADSLEAWR